jgi:muconolactone delta-isomerase
MTDTPNDNEHVVPRRSWMVELDLPVPISGEFAARIPEQRMRIGKLMSAGTMLSYTLTADRKKLWTVILADSEGEVQEVLESFPIISWTQYSIHELFFHEYALGGIPRMSMN